MYHQVDKLDKVYNYTVLLRWIRSKVRCRLSRLSGGVRLDPGAFILEGSTSEVNASIPLLIAGHVQNRLLTRERERERETWARKGCECRTVRQMVRLVADGSTVHGQRGAQHRRCL